MNYISKGGIRWYIDVQQQDFGAAEHEQIVNGPSCRCVRGKGCCASKFSPIPVTVIERGVMDVIVYIIHPPAKGTPCKNWYCISALLLPILLETKDEQRRVFFMLWKPQPFQIDVETQRWASLQELMLHLSLRKVPLNKEVQLPALSVQHFAWIKHNDRWCFELVAK